MRKLLFIFLQILLFTTLVDAQEKQIRLIVRGDDMGFSHSGNQALVKAYKDGIQTSIEVMVPTPWFPEAVQMLKENPNIDVGIHLVLTSEWDLVKWRPVTGTSSLTDSNGYFFPMIWKNKNYPQNALLEHNWKLEDVEKEFRAQIELAKKLIPRLSHISGHMGCTHMSDSVKALSRRLAKEYNIDIDPSEHGVKGVGYDGPSKTYEEKVSSFIKMLNKLEPGNTYLFVDHPGLFTPELQAYHHIGYENVASDRQGVTDTWTNEKVKETIRKRKIQLISYKDLLKK
jgi:chitin disaccharide deacetylase